MLVATKYYLLVDTIEYSSLVSIKYSLLKDNIDSLEYSLLVSINHSLLVPLKYEWQVMGPKEVFYSYLVPEMIW